MAERLAHLLGDVLRLLIEDKVAGVLVNVTLTWLATWVTGVGG